MASCDLAELSDRFRCSNRRALLHGSEHVSMHAHSHTRASVDCNLADVVILLHLLQVQDADAEDDSDL